MLPNIPTLLVQLHIIVLFILIKFKNIKIQLYLCIELKVAMHIVNSAYKLGLDILLIL